MATRTRRRIDINSASAEEIERACGIDGALAQRIIQYRHEHGPFSTREDLDEIPGFAEVGTNEVLSVVDLPPRRPSRRGTRSNESSSRKNNSRTRRGDSGPHAQGSRPDRPRARSRSAEPTTDHAFIRRWVEERDGWPACVRGTGDDRGDVGMIRIDFPGFSGGDSLERIEWETWFEQFEENQLAFLYRELRHSDGQLDRFNKLVSREPGASRSRSRR